jgi:hypothetical protein
MTSMGTSGQVSRIVAMKPRIAGTNDRALNVPCPYMLIPTQV